MLSRANYPSNGEESLVTYLKKTLVANEAIKAFMYFFEMKVGWRTVISMHKIWCINTKTLVIRESVAIHIRYG